MREPKMEWSDEFVFDDADLALFEEMQIEDEANPRHADSVPERRAYWQILEDRLGAKKLSAELADWDYWDDLTSTH